MDTRRIPTHAPGSDGWAQQRATGLGGSEVAAVLGLSPWESRFSLWHRKSGLIGPSPDMPATEWGRRLEAVILAKWAEDRPLANLQTGLTYLRDGWQIASPDAVATFADGAVEPVEIKAPQYDDEWGTPGTDEIPPYYLTQTRWYLHIGGWKRIHVAALFRGIDYREYVVEQDADDINLMVAEGRRFLDSIAAGERPDIDAHSATYQAVKQLHPLIEPVRVDVPDDVALAYVEAVAAAKSADTAKTEETARLADHMGNAKAAVWDGHTIATRQARGDGTPYVVASRNLTRYAKEIAA
ncbi:putative phage-type endonuclease [Naumannella halotolerans]|uniref:Putative phage-type endonuclease n=2 Tax=Naumannella halotolerans TaxID=993414 RepID=A0A4V3EMV8_9ACTN|nr:putative phage-type endonuclease [Naumannella halotolerans]